MSINLIIENKLCTGCGVCISEDLSKTSKMEWSSENFLVPAVGKSQYAEAMYNVCPFKKNQINEDKLGKYFFSSQSSSYNNKIGYYNGLYIGYSKEYRRTSSSGGIATYIFKQLLERKIVDALYVVQEKDNGFAYAICESVKDIKNISKTRYMPVTLEGLFDLIDNTNKKIAISGVACFVKAIRIKQKNNPQLKERIPFVVGIICGGLKSKYYTDYLAQEAQCFDPYDLIEYRVKKENSFALDYQFKCENKDTKRIHLVDMQKLGDMWGTGLFKTRACDFCDDVVTELADISLGDAWIPPYSLEGLGNNIVIARSKLANDIVLAGTRSDDLFLNEASEEQIISSQGGSYNHRHKGLKYRISSAQKNKEFIPNKRERFYTNTDPLFNIIQYYRNKIRENSLKYWIEKKDYKYFNEKLKADRKKLNLLSKIYRKFNQIKSLLIRK